MLYKWRKDYDKFGTSHLSETPDLMVAPNPANTQTTVYYHYVTAKTAKEIVVLDVLSRPLYKTTPTEKRGDFILNTSNFADGTYFVWMKENDKIIERTKLIIKN